MGRPGCSQCCKEEQEDGIIFECACLHTKSGFPQGSGDLDDYWNIPFPNNPYSSAEFDPKIHPANEDKFEYILVIHNWNGKENDQFKMCFNGEDFGIVNPVTIDDYWTHVYGTSDEIIDHFLYGSDKGGGLNIGAANMELTPPRVSFDDAQPKVFFNRTIYKTVVNKDPFMMDGRVYGQLFSGSFGILDNGFFRFKFEKTYDTQKDVVVNATILRYDLHTNPGPQNFYINGSFRSKVDPDDDRTKDEYDSKTFTFAPGQEFYLPCPLGGDIVQFCDSQFCVNLGEQVLCCPTIISEVDSTGLTKTVPNDDCQSAIDFSSTAACACGSSGATKVCNDSLYFYLNSDNPRSAFNLNDPCPETYYKYPSEVAQNHPISYVRDIFSNIPDSSPEIDTIFAVGDDLNSFFFWSEGPISYNFIGDPATHSNNTANDCVKDPNTGIVKRDCICCTPIDYDPASREYRTCPDDDRFGSVQNGIETFNPPENSCSSDQLFFTIPFQGQTVYVEVNFVSTGVFRSEVYCHGTERTIEWDQEYNQCDICRIEQFPQQGLVFNGVLGTVCGFGEFGVIPCRTCPQPFDFSIDPNFVSPVEGASFVYYDNKTSNCIAYFYDEQTGTYTTKIV